MGITDSFKTAKLEKQLIEIIKMRKKYGKELNEVKVSGRVKIEFHKIFNTLYIYVNGNKYIKYNYGKIVGTVKDITHGVSLGLLDSGISFETKDKTVTTKSFIQDICKEIESNITSIERQFKGNSDKKWK